MYILKTKTARSNIMGTGSVTFAFKRFADARVIADKLRSVSPYEKVWYTVVKPDKFVLTTASQIFKKPNMMGGGVQLVMVDPGDFLKEMMEFNMAVRVIDGVDIDRADFYTLHSETGYEPHGKTTEDHIIMLEKMAQV